MAHSGILGFMTLPPIENENILVQGVPPKKVGFITSYTGCPRQLAIFS